MAYGPTRSEFAGRRDFRHGDAIGQMSDGIAGRDGRRLLYRDLVAPTHLSASPF